MPTQDLQRNAGFHLLAGRPSDVLGLRRVAGGAAIAGVSGLLVSMAINMSGQGMTTYTTESIER
jgi:hypothetical protein